MRLYLPRYLKIARNLISQCGHSNWDTWKKIAQSLSLFISKQKILKFFYKWINIIYKFEGCFLSGQVSSNSFKVFSSCIVVDCEQSLFFLGPLSKTPETSKWPRAWLKAWDGRGMTKERLPAKPERMVFHGLVIFWHENWSVDRPGTCSASIGNSFCFSFIK